MISLQSVYPGALRFLFLKKSKERIVVAAFCGDNRPSEFAEHQRKVFDHFRIPINQVFVDFSEFNHGTAVDAFLSRISRAYDYFILFDTDAVPLRGDFIDLAYEKIRDKRTLYGLAQQSNHIPVNGSTNHVYVGPGALAISRELYVALSRPSFAGTGRSDTAEELTWRAEELGYTVALVFPSRVQRRLWDLGNGHSFGIGTTYGDCIFHAFAQNDRHSKKLFLDICKSILKRRRRGRTRSRRRLARDE